MSAAAGRSSVSSRGVDSDDIEPAIREVLARTLRKRVQGPYAARTDSQVREGLERLFAAEGCDGIRITDLGRLAGGASKEMFCFSLRHDGSAEPERLVLRMDPLESIVETSRRREAEILRAIRDTVPVPEVRALDHEGELLGQSGVVTSFVAGVTRPAGAGTAVTGIGTDYGSSAARIAPPFLENLIAIHDFDWRSASLPSLTPPSAHPRQAALWQANWYLRVWEQDALEALPLASLLRRWLRENAPECSDPRLVHADYRMGNFLFDEETGEMTAVLDWELAHLGDFHEDLAYVTQKLFGRVNEKGEFLCCGLFPREQFLGRYQELSGRTVDPETLRYYEVLNAWKSVVHTFATCVRVATEGNNHQDVLLSWLASVGHVFVSEIAGLLGARRVA